MNSKLLEAIKKEYRTFVVVGVTNDGNYLDCHVPSSMEQSTVDGLQFGVRFADKKKEENHGRG